MTSQLSPPRPAGDVPRPPRGPHPAPPTPLVTSAAVAALRAVALGLVPLGLLVVLGWATAQHAGATAGEAVRTAVALWLVAHHVALAVPGGTVGLAPIGLMAVPVCLLVGAGRRAARGSRPTGRREHAILLGVLGGTYALATTGAALLARTAQVRPSVPLALTAGLLLALVCAGAGAARESGSVAARLGRIPASARAVASGAAAGASLLVGAGALLCAAAVAVHAGRIAQVARALDPGLLGSVLLVAVCVVLAPNAAVAGAAVAVGPGFAVGQGTSVTAFTATLGGVPTLPLLAALPTTGPLPLPVLLVLTAPVLAGAVVAWVTVRRLPEPAAGGRTAWVAAGWCAAAGGAGGVALGLLVALAGGPVGGGRMAAIGASPWQVGLGAAAELALVAAVTGWVVTRRPLTVSWTLTP